MTVEDIFVKQELRFCLIPKDFLQRIYIPIINTVACSCLNNSLQPENRMTAFKVSNFSHVGLLLICLMFIIFRFF